MASEPEEHLVDDEGDAAGPPPVVEDGADADALRAVPVAARRHAVRGARRHVRARRVRGDRLRRAGPRAPSSAGGSTRCRRGERSTSATASVVLAGLGARHRDAAGPAARRRPAARHRARRTGSTSWTSSCRWRAGDRPSGRVDLAAIGAVLRDDPELASYAERLDDPALRSRFRGYLTGSVDLVVRRGDRFAVVDYKTNWLGAPGEELSGVASPPGGAGGGDAPLALRAAGAALHRRAAPLPALADAGLRPRAQPRGRAVPVPARDGRAGHAGRSATCRAACSRGGRRPRSWTRLSDVLDGRGMSLAETRPVRGRPRAARARAAARVQRRRRAEPRPTCTSRSASRCWPARRTTAVALAAALAVRGPRMGHVHVDLATARDTAAVDEDEDVDVTRCRGPSPATGRARVARSPLVAVGEDADGEPSAAPRRRRAVPRPLLARGARASPPTSAPAGRRARRPASTTRCSRRARRGSSETSATACRLAPARSAVRGASPSSPAGRARARRRRSRGSSRSLAEQARAAGAPPPLVALAAPTGKAAARLEEAVHDAGGGPGRRRGDPRTASSTCAPRRCTGCSAGGRTARAASATSAATGCRTTS